MKENKISLCSWCMVFNGDLMVTGDKMLFHLKTGKKLIIFFLSWCKREGPTDNFPALSPYGNLKVRTPSELVQNALFSCKRTVHAFNPNGNPEVKTHQN